MDIETAFPLCVCGCVERDDFVVETFCRTLGTNMDTGAIQCECSRAGVKLIFACTRFDKWGSARIAACLSAASTFPVWYHSFDTQHPSSCRRLNEKTMDNVPSADYLPTLHHLLLESHLDMEDRVAKVFRSHQHFCTTNVMMHRSEFAHVVIRSHAVEMTSRSLDRSMEMVCCRSEFLSVE